MPKERRLSLMDILLTASEMHTEAMHFLEFSTTTAAEGKMEIDSMTAEIGENFSPGDIFEASARDCDQTVVDDGQWSCDQLTSSPSDGNIERGAYNFEKYFASVPSFNNRLSCFGNTITPTTSLHQIDPNALTLENSLAMDRELAYENSFEPRPIHPLIEGTLQDFQYQVDLSSVGEGMMNNENHAHDNRNERIRGRYSLSSGNEYVKRLSFNGFKESDEMISEESMKLLQLEAEGCVNNSRIVDDDFETKVANLFSHRSFTDQKALCQPWDTYQAASSSTTEQKGTAVIEMIDCKKGDDDNVDFVYGVGVDFNDLEKHNQPTLSSPPVLFHRLKQIMKKSCMTQRALEEWDKKNGLPKSHSATMVRTNRSRKQIEENRILPKWNGKPLIGGGSGGHSNTITPLSKMGRIHKKSANKVKKSEKYTTIIYQSRKKW